MGKSRALFLFSSFQQLTIDRFVINFRQRLDSNCGPLVSEATDNHCPKFISTEVWFWLLFCLKYIFIYFTVSNVDPSYLCLFKTVSDRFIIISNDEIVCTSLHYSVGLLNHAIVIIFFLQANIYRCEGRSPGLVVMGGDSRSKGHGFESRHHILDGHFSHWFVVKIVLFVWKRPKINEKEAGFGPFKKNHLSMCTI